MSKGMAVPLETQPIKQGIFKQGSVFEGALFYRSSNHFEKAFESTLFRYDAAINCLAAMKQ